MKYLQDLKADQHDFLVKGDIGQRLFELHKPWYVRAISDKDRVVCACHKHCNVKELVVALARQRRRMQDLGVVYSFVQVQPITDSLNATVGRCLCQLEPGGSRKRACIYGECQTCGADKLLKHEAWELDPSFRPTVRDSLTGGTKQVEQALCSYEVFEKGADKRLCFSQRQETVAKVLSRLMEGMKKGADSLAVFTRHQFIANWQHKQFTELFDVFDKDEWVLQYDFAENHTFNFKYEVQQYHWNKTYCSLLVFVGYRHAPESTEHNRVVVKEEYHFISDDKEHDPSFVDWCLNLWFSYNIDVTNNNRVSGAVKKQIDQVYGGGRKLTAPKRVYIWSDGAPTQFKLKDAFFDHAFHAHQYGVEIWRSYYGSGHGKGVHDSAGGTIKRACADYNDRNPSLSMGSLKDANDMYQFCKLTLQKPKESTFASRNASVWISERHFFLVKPNDFNHEAHKVRVIKGSSKQHLFIFAPTTNVRHFQVRMKLLLVVLSILTKNVCSHGLLSATVTSAACSGPSTNATTWRCVNSHRGRS